MTVPNKLTLLARAEARIFQCVVIDQHLQKRNIAVYVCGSDVLWAPTREGLFDADRARRAPNWLIEQINNPPDHADVYDSQGNKLSRREKGGVVLEPAPKGPTKLEPVEELGGEDSIRQG